MHYHLPVNKFLLRAFVHFLVEALSPCGLRDQNSRQTVHIEPKPGGTYQLIEQSVVSHMTVPDYTRTSDK